MKKNFLLTIPLLFVVKFSYAGDPNARDWIPAPAGTNLLANYVYDLKDQGFYTKGSKVDAKIDLHAQGVVLRPMFFRNIGDLTVQYELIAPLSRTSLKQDDASDKLSGFGDVQAGAAIWFYNNQESKTWFAWEPFLTIPTGKYDEFKADVSPGKNRWTTVQDFAFVKGIGETTYFESVAEFEFYRDNKDYYGMSLSKSTSKRLFFLISTDITPTTYVGVRYRLEWGGKEKAKDIVFTENLNNRQIAFEATSQLTEQDQVQIQYLKDISVENGPKMKGFQFRYVHAF